SVGVAASGRYASALILLVVGAGLSTLLGTRIRGGRGRWHGFGTLYVGLPSIAILWVRAQPEQGLATVVWMLAVVIAVDSGAFAAGRLLGGPKLMPSISPNKTWAGLLGGMAAAAVVGLVAAVWLQ